MKSNRPSISTGGGDKGETSLFFGGRVPKTCNQIEATGDCDELSAALGLAKAFCPDEKRKAEIEKIQMDLIDLMGHISLNRHGLEEDIFPFPDEKTQYIEKLGKELEEKLPALNSWDLPGKNPESAAMHLARTICRRCERTCLKVPERHRASDVAITYLNRLSDLLWLLARAAGTSANNE